MKLTKNKYLMTRKGKLMEFWIVCNPKNSTIISISNGWESHLIFREDWKRIESMSDLINCSVSRRVTYSSDGRRRISYMRLCDYMQYLRLHEPTFYELVTAKEVDEND